MNILWAGMIIAGIIYGAFCGTLSDVSAAAVESSKEAVTLCVTMLGVMAFWMGIMKIAESSGLIDALKRMLDPVISFLFPKVPRDHPARAHIASNMIANIMGLGWAATPAGLSAMKSLKELDVERGGKSMGQVASEEMCTFLIINISSLQLIPVNIIAYRSQYGSVNPSAITGPALIATAISTAAAVIFCKIMGRISHR